MDARGDGLREGDPERDKVPVTLTVELLVPDGDDEGVMLGAGVPLAVVVGVPLAEVLTGGVMLRLTVPVRVLDPAGERDVEGVGDRVEEGVPERDGDPVAVPEGDGEVEARVAPTDTTWACRAVDATDPSGTLL